MADFTFIIGQKKTNFFENLKFKNIFYARKKIFIDTNKKNLYAFSGLGNNLSFFNSIKESNYNLKKYKEFNDHHSYKDYEIEEMINESKNILSNVKPVYYVAHFYIFCHTIKHYFAKIYK